MGDTYQQERHSCPRTKQMSCRRRKRSIRLAFSLVQHFYPAIAPSYGDAGQIAAGAQIGGAELVR
jgi:hypothetical protein